MLTIRLRRVHRDASEASSPKFARAKFDALVFDGDVPSERDGQTLEARAQRALVAIRRGDATDALAEVTPPQRDAAIEIRAFMTLLFSKCSAMVTALGDGGAIPVRVQVFDDAGAEVSIDSADPPIRTAVRTLLAEVQGNAEAAKEQLDIALTNATPDEIAALVLHALRWTIRLATECVQRDLPIPGWIANAIKT